MSLLRYDRDVDALYIDISKATVHNTDEIEPGVILDYDASGNIVGIEILDFMERLHGEGEELEIDKGKKHIASIVGMPMPPRPDRVSNPNEEQPAEAIPAKHHP